MEGKEEKKSVQDPQEAPETADHSLIRAVTVDEGAKRGKYKQVLDSSYEFSVDKLKKRILRMFRENVIQQYKDQTQNKQYHWIRSSVRKSVRSFFMETYQFDEDFYNKHESLLMFMVLKEEKLEKKFGVSNIDHEAIRIMKLTFGTQPTLSNMRKLMRHPVMEVLWTGIEGVN